jgi:chromosome segregation ATPase
MPDQPTTSRDRLRQAITKVREAEQQLVTLEHAQTRARERSWQARSQLSDAQDALARSQRNEQHRLAEEFLNDGELADPIADAKSNVTTAQSEVDRLDKVEAALATEVDKVQSSLPQLRVNQYTIMAEIVSSSPEYQALLDQHNDAWMRLRSIRTALREVSTGLHGQMPQPLLDQQQRSEPLDIKLLLMLLSLFLGN